jgi:hypothetical protein
MELDSANGHEGQADVPDHIIEVIESHRRTDIVPGMEAGYRTEKV